MDNRIPLSDLCHTLGKRVVKRREVADLLAEPACAKPLRRRQASSLAGESGYAQAGVKVWR